MTKPKARLKFKTYDLVRQAVVAGTQYASRRVFKHTDTPSQEEIATICYNAVMLELCEIIDFENE